MAENNMFTCKRIVITRIIVEACKYDLRISLWLGS